MMRFKRLAALLLCGILLLGTVACGKQKESASQEVVPAVAETAQEAEPVPEENVQLTNPVHTVADYNALLAAVPDVLMANAPKGAENVAYSWIEGTPAIAQISFTLDGFAYTYRGAKVDSAESMADITGVYDTLEKTIERIAPDKDGLIGGTYVLNYSAGSTVGKATWYYSPTGCQYSVSTPDGCDVSQGILNVVEQVMPIAEISREDLPVSGSVEGVTVVAFEDGELTVNTSDGKTLLFNMGMLPDASFQTGGVLDITYNLTGTTMFALDTVENKTAAAAEANTISGTVFSFTKDSVYISTESDMVYGFVLDTDTAYSGESSTLRVGSEVTIAYEGDLASDVHAKTIKTNKVGTGSAKPSSQQQGGYDDGGSTDNKRLNGYVTDYSGGSITIVTSNGHYWTFRISSLTSIFGNYTLGEGSKVRIDYDGYASEAPLANKIQVYSDKNYDPYPQPTAVPAPTKHTMEGFLLTLTSNDIRIDTASGNQHEFTITPATEIVGYCDYYGNVRITYVGDEEAGYKVATRIVLG